MRHSASRSQTGTDESSSLLDGLRAALVEPNSRDAIAGFVALASISLGTRYLADLQAGDLADDWLLPAAVQAEPVLAALGLAAILAVHFLGRGSVLLGWGDLERGGALRFFTAVLIVAVTWRFVTADFDWVYGQWWALDRLLLAIAAMAALWRPVAIVPFLAQLRILQTPLHDGFDFALGVTPDGLLVNALAAVAATALVAAAFGHRRTSIVVSMVASATAIEFFVSGRRKLEEGWLALNDLANFPLNGHHQGWLGATGGDVADLLSTFFATFRWPLLLGTLVIEVGAIVLIARRGSLMLALGSFVVFHIFVFLSFGFSFLEWSLVEVGLLLLLLGEHGRRWSAPAFRPIPIALSMFFVLFGSAVFNPPTLFWFDGPVTYAYEFDGVDVDGNERLLVANDFTPHESAFAFGFLHLGPTRPIAAGYGAMNRQRLDDVASVTTFAELERLEEPIPDGDARRERTVANLERFLLETGRAPTLVDRLPGGPTRYSTSRSGQNYEAGIELATLTVTRVTVLRVDGDVLIRREPVLTLTVVGDDVEVEWADEPA